MICTQNNDFQCSRWFIKLMTIVRREVASKFKCLRKESKNLQSSNLLDDKKSETCFLSLKFQQEHEHGRKYGRIISSKSKKLFTMVRLWPGSQGPLEEGQPGALSAAFSGEGYAGAPGLAADPCGTPDLYRLEYLQYTKPLNPLIVL